MTTSRLYTGAARALDGIPVVTTTAARNARYPSPPEGFRVYNREVASTQMYTGGAWVAMPGTPGDTATVPISSYSGDVGVAIAAAIAALPASGGIVDARSASGAQTMAADLTINRGGVTILLPFGVVTSAFRILVSPGVQNVALLGPTPWKASGGYGFTLAYTGTGQAISVGDSSATSEMVSLENMLVDVSGGGTSAVAVALNRLVYFGMRGMRTFTGNSASTRTGVRCDGTGYFTGHGLIENLRHDGGGTGILLTGTGVNASNAIQILGGGLAGQSAGTGIYVPSGVQSNGNFVYGMDLENWGIGIRDDYGYNTYEVRLENNTLDAQFGASSTRTVLRTQTAATYTDSGNNTVMTGGLWQVPNPLHLTTNVPRTDCATMVDLALSSSDTTQYGALVDTTTSASATGTGIGTYCRTRTAASAHTQAKAVADYIAAVVKGAGSTITKAVGQVLEAQTVGTTNAYNEKQDGNGGYWETGYAAELLTLSTSGATTDTSANLLPADAIIEAVTVRVTTTITTAANFSVGDATTAARFVSATTGITAGSTVVGLLHQAGNVTTTAAGPTQAAAAKVRITCNATPGAGVVRIIVYYRRFVAPTS